MATKKEVAEVINMLLDAYPHYKPRSIPGLVKLWARKFKDTEAEILRKAADMHLDRSKFFPAIHEIVTLLDMAWYEVQDDKDTALWNTQTQETRDFWNAMMEADGRVATAPGHWSKSDPEKVTANAEAEASEVVLWLMEAAQCHYHL